MKSKRNSFGHHMIGFETRCEIQDVPDIHRLVVMHEVLYFSNYMHTWFWVRTRK